jgi:hypothetical protein
MVFGMGSKIRRFGFTSLLACVLIFAMASSRSAATTIGSVLTAVPNLEACGTGFMADIDRPCTTTQATLAANQTAAGGLVSSINGVIVNWTVRSGPATPDTVRVKLRLRTLRGNVGGGTGNQVDLPLSEPGLHTFAERLPIRSGESIGITALVTNQNSGDAGAPIIRQEAGIGTSSRLESSLPEGSTAFVNEQPDTELMLNATIEPDADHDGFGDETQDRCATDPSIQVVACPADRTAPRTKVTYQVRQDFLGEKKVVVHLRSDETASVFASGQLEVPSKHSIWGVYGDRTTVKAHHKVTLRLRFPRKTRAAAERAIDHGQKAIVKVTVAATDAAGNESGKTVATIKQKR